MILYANEIPKITCKCLKSLNLNMYFIIYMFFFCENDRRELHFFGGKRKWMFIIFCGKRKTVMTVYYAKNKNCGEKSNDLFWIFSNNFNI